ncbi:hypothetical protein H4582DRAFT_817191 [Lactarius indigo]|nr:hypothetical protein H4582DRAFT_817191 [Lactarius indigo]
MSTSFQSDAESMPPSDAPGSSPSFSGPFLPGELNSPAGVGSISPFQTEPFGHTRQERKVTKRYRNVPLVPRVYDFAVDHDNALYDLTHTTFDDPTISTESTLSLISPLDLASSSPFFDLTEFESFGSSLYTQFNADPQAWTAAEIPPLNLSAPSPLSFDDALVNVHEEVDATPNKDIAQSPHTFLMQLTAQPLPQVATAPSPTPSLSFSAPSTFSSPSPASIVDDDFTMLDDDPDYGLPASTCGNKHSSSATGGPSARKVKIYAGPATSFPGRSAGRFPCSVPGCKQICKTLGDLKRHESVLAHKPPSWECPRCHYHFTREDALKRHAKNVSNCGSTNVKARGRGASVRPQNLGTTMSNEVS